jgi:ribosomal protein S15P/S13E
MENLTTQLRNVGKTEIAHLYHPCENVSDEAARRWLNRKIQQNKHLLTLLERNGYNKYSHTFTPSQVMLILNELGTPLRLISRKLIVTNSDILELFGKK